jgi:hypothetical protein
MSKRIYDPLSRQGLILDPALKADLNASGLVSTDQIFAKKNLSEWTALNPVLENGQMVLVATNNDGLYNAAKIGNGVTTFNLLPYSALYPSSAIETNVMYGVEIDTSVSSPDTSVTRIGNLSLHASLPIHNRMMGCLLNDSGQVVEYLSSNWNSHDLTGARGQVMVEIPAFYIKFETDSTKLRVKLSEYPLPGYIFVKKHYISAYEATLQRSNNKLSSVVNLTTDFRGGANTSSWDSETRSLLGCPVTNLSRTAFRTNARNRNAAATTEWNLNDYFTNVLIYWLFVVEYKTLNSQKAVNTALDGSGYRQGGLGDGVTNINGTRWNEFNGYNPFVKTGHSNALGNSTGQASYTMPFQYDCLVAGIVTPSSYKGEFSISTTYYVNDHVSSGTKLYRCIEEANGFPVTDITKYTEITRTTTNVNRYRGLELPFGHIWKWTDGVNIEIKSVADGDTSKLYISNNPAHYNDSNYNNYEFRGLTPRPEGWIRNVVFGLWGDILPSVNGGGSTQYYCDYNYTSIPSSGTSLRGVLLGGSAANGSAAGLVCVYSYYGPSAAFAFLGSRLCFIPNN